VPQDNPQFDPVARKELLRLFFNILHIGSHWSDILGRSKTAFSLDGACTARFEFDSQAGHGAWLDLQNIAVTVPADVKEAAWRTALTHSSSVCSKTSPYVALKVRLDLSLRHMTISVLIEVVGAASNDFKRFVKNFYDKADDGSATSNKKALVDQRLFNKVWRWLIRHPDIFIGKDGSRKDISLGDFEASEAEAARSGDDDSRANVRLFASEERTWYCLTGHGIDTKRVPQMEFELLSIIAFNGKDGILQPDLVRASGQDKRSVPKRTDNLCQKGLITKDGAMGGHTRTTRLTLKKFVSKGTPVGEEGSEDILSKAVFMNGCLIYENFLDYLLDHFSKFNDIISLPQLHQSLVSHVPFPPKEKTGALADFG
jgi:hypothetical protein